MGAKKKALRVVVDTNVLVSALLFRGPLARIVEAWEHGRIVPIVSAATFAEFRRVLGYPKFSLTKEDIVLIVEQHILPFFEVVEVNAQAAQVCRDPQDDKFLACAVAGTADFLVTCDRDLLDLERYKGIGIIPPADLLRRL